MPDPPAPPATITGSPGVRADERSARDAYRIEARPTSSQSRRCQPGQAVGELAGKLFQKFLVGLVHIGVGVGAAYGGLLTVEPGDQPATCLVAKVQAALTAARRVVHHRWHRVRQLMGEVHHACLMALGCQAQLTAEQPRNLPGPGTGRVDRQVTLELAAACLQTQPATRERLGALQLGGHEQSCACLHSQLAQAAHSRDDRR